MSASKKLQELDDLINNIDENSIYAAQTVLAALPAFIAIVEAVEDLQVNPRLGHEDWEGEVFAARYRALRALGNLERGLEDA